MKKNETSSRIVIIDALRGFAAILITWYHIYQFSWQSFNFRLFNIHFKVDLLPRIGFMGVEIFFFLSAFGLFYSYAKYYVEKAKKPDLKSFYLKRLKKIVPSYYLAMILILLFFNVETFTSASKTFFHIITHLLFIHNISTDTFGSINGVFWFMAVIFQLTLIFPLLAYLFKKDPVITILGLCIISLVYRSMIPIYFENIFFFMLSQVPGFLDIIAMGMLSAYAIVFIKHYFKNINSFKIPFTIISIIFIYFLSYIFFTINLIENRTLGIFTWQVNYRFLFGFVLMGITVSTTFAFPIWKKIIANPLFNFLGTISYNLFIWHFILCRFFLRIKFPSYTTPDPHDDALWRISYFFIILGLSIITAGLITFFFEKPILRLTKKQIIDFKSKILSTFMKFKR